MHRIFIIITLLTCINTHANEGAATSDTKWAVSVGGHQNWFIDDGYYEFSSAESSYVETHKMGWEAGVYYQALEFSKRISLSLEYSEYGNLGASAQACSNAFTCVKRTEVQQSWLMSNVYYLVDKKQGISFYTFAGAAYVLAKGSVLNESWDSNTIGFQGGLKLLIEEPSRFNPYLGVRISQFDLESESNSDAASAYNISIMLGAQF
jgi:opacity protein-like surface antigen